MLLLRVAFNTTALPTLSTRPIYSAAHTVSLNHNTAGVCHIPVMWLQVTSGRNDVLTMITVLAMAVAVLDGDDDWSDGDDSDDQYSLVMM